MELLFGVGALWGQRTDVANIGPDQFAVLQDNTIEFDFETKELYSQSQFPIDIARGKGKVTGKAKFARVFGALYADLFFGLSDAVGQTTVAEYESHVIATNTVVSTNATAYVDDLGVYYSGATGLKLSRVYTVSPSAGQYSVNVATGTYTIGTGDIGATVVLSYVYTIAGTGDTITITNQFMGTTPTFKATFYTQRSTLGGSGQLTLRLNQCVSSRLSFPSTIDNYNIPDFDFQAFADSSGTIGLMSMTER
jgi:hypothetical protein